MIPSTRSLLTLNGMGLLRTKLDLLDETVRELGFKRRGPKIVAAVERAITTDKDRTPDLSMPSADPGKDWAQCSQEEKLQRLSELEGVLSESELQEARRRVLDEID